MRNQRTFVIGFAVSMLMNAFMGGFLLSKFLHHGPLDGPMGRGPIVDLQRSTDVLDPENKAQVQKIIDAHFNKDQDRRAEMGAHFSKIQSVLTADKFDENQLKEAIRALDDYDQTFKINISSMLQEIAKTLPDEQRIKLFKEFDAHRPHGGGPPK